MLSAIISTHESERALVPTLAALVPGTMAGLLTEVIVADAGSSDATAEVADLAGCRFMTSTAPTGERLNAAATAARAPWLLFLHAGDIPDAGWIDESARFIDAVTNGSDGGVTAATFRPIPAFGLLALIGRAFGAGATRGHGLLIAKRDYQSLAGHRADAAAEADLLRRIGRRRIVTLRCGLAVTAGDT